ncbi:MAG: fumarate hydratase [Methanomassiliicoccales archaeon]|nr:fumarate hydratase [Methanomassiliicoccales archaeon]
MISSQLIEEVVVNLLRKASTAIPRDVLRALENSIGSETSNVARVQLQAILDNIKMASVCSIPICQDTGIPLFFVRGDCSSEVFEGIRSGVRRATEEIPLRPNVVHPITRKNPGNNLGERMPFVHFLPSQGDYFEITVMPKGAGSENMSALKMLNPSDGIEGIKELVLETVVNAGGKPCPPIIVGIGVGGSSDIATTLAKEALLVSLEKENTDPILSSLEREIHTALNQTGIGPMGLGGRTTVLGVKIKMAYCHTASLPVAINLQCWAARKATARIFEDGTVLYSLEGFE